MATDPGERYSSYTNDLPYDANVGNLLTSDALLFLVQTLVGDATADYRADPSGFYDFSLEKILRGSFGRRRLQRSRQHYATAGCLPDQANMTDDG